jgi:hypothetical protein
MKFTHMGVPMVNGLGLIFVLSHGDLTWNYKDLKMLDAITCGPRVSLILEKVNWLRGISAEGVSPRFKWERDISQRLTCVMSLE